VQSKTKVIVMQHALQWSSLWCCFRCMWSVD